MNLSLRLLALLSTLFATSPLLAQENLEIDEVPAVSNELGSLTRGARWIENKLDGELTLDYFDYFRDSPIDSTDPFFQANLVLDFAGQVNDTTSYVIKPRFQIDNAGRAAETFDFIETSNDRYYANFDELFIDYYASNYQITAGKQIYSWGVSDTYKPVENLNPSDVMDLPTARKMGVYSLGAAGIWDSFSLETVLTPWFTPTRLPRQDNRWVGNTQPQSDALRSLLGFDPSIDFAGRELPSNSFENVQGGARLASSSLIPGWDLGLTYVQGRDPVGVIRAGVAAPPVVTVTQVFQRFHEFGATVSTTFGSVEVHAEAAYRDTINNAFDDDFIEYVTGINYTYYNMPGVEEVRLVAEYAGEGIVSGKESGNAFVPTGQYIRPFKNSFLSSLEFRFSEETQFIVGSALNFNDQDFYLQPKISHQFNNGIELDIGLDFMEGNQNSFFGRWERNNRLFVMTRYAF
jgi:hypothetical protein